MRRPGQYENLKANGQRVMNAMSKHLTKAGHDHQLMGHPTMFDVVFTNQPVHDYRGVMSGDKAKAGAFNCFLREEGIFKSPSKTYISLLLSEEDLQKTEFAIERAASKIA